MTGNSPPLLLFDELDLPSGVASQFEKRMEKELGDVRAALRRGLSLFDLDPAVFQKLLLTLAQTPGEEPYQSRIRRFAVWIHDVLVLFGTNCEDPEDAETIERSNAAIEMLALGDEFLRRVNQRAAEQVAARFPTQLMADLLKCYDEYRLTEAFFGSFDVDHPYRGLPSIRDDPRATTLGVAYRIIQGRIDQLQALWHRRLITGDDFTLSMERLLAISSPFNDNPFSP